MTWVCQYQYKMNCNIYKKYVSVGNPSYNGELYLDCLWSDFKMSLKQITVRYEGNNCSKCGREMKVGWTGFFEARNNEKFLYCQPCAKVVRDSHGSEVSINADSETKAIFEYMGALDIKINSIIDILEKIQKTISKKK